ncbi:anthranilate synthase component II [Microvirga lotononidis]|uniref:Glutamine amidotransferase of anthranilate synthase or aminodeoxychorismate synthase n=1 Tax=Microvirga lotononidis TaxID=864069 RepID=I4Z3W4_9HYPH|nr:aminodeoxychorismate/anthranilate synthase component II [Microvirga lotononidis]EIM30906.1 glutamine amidotransferase of anthranilate synthase or aminodeoxychorismate synthase [Microvirga lotononidis]WQO30139.1 aminodeoxychorismate/anthranilate synthase component II [Microvirga lotononidis]
MILIIDNYDSFVFNVARYFSELGETVKVVRNDAIDVGAVRGLSPRAVVLSPGPCSPLEAGVSCEIVRHLSGLLPLLGICLGHQCIGQVFGWRVTRAHNPMHGRSSAISHSGQGIFNSLPNPLKAGRYHSLIVEEDRSSTELEVTARSEDGEIMALQHRRHPTYGVQFHPESILTEHGHTLLSNFLDIAAKAKERRHAVV